ncbi:MAG: glycosyltransferase family 4 protein [Desulfobacterales bacterium]|jgi:glycosyltransferase involved in cell wall biosynthesis|nr:glycosyltransferase family 4 protein [Desulfobacterales bacterium]
MKKIIIVQNKPTQFDAPFYALAAREKLFGLHVFYSEGHQDSVDPEIGRMPVWDHLTSDGYPKTFLSELEAGDTQNVCRRILKEKPDLVILCGYFPALHARLAWMLKKKGVRIGLRSDNTRRHSNLKGVKGIIKRLGLPLWLRRYNTWHPVGTLAAEYLRWMAGSEKPVYYFPYSADNAWFEKCAKECQKDRNHIRQEMGFRNDDFIVLGLMKWTQREDPLTLVESIKQVKHRGGAAKLILAGDGPLRPKVAETMAEIKETIYLPGYLPYSQLPKYYAISDLFVHPAVNEPWGVSVNEAMACGVPVLAAEGVGSGRDLIVEGKTGYTFPDGDKDALSDLILKLSQDRNRMHAMGQAAKQRVDAWSYWLTMREMAKALED